jgi:hypothetical protein
MLSRDLRSAGILLLLALGLASCAGESSTSSKGAAKPAAVAAARIAAATTTTTPDALASRTPSHASRLSHASRVSSTGIVRLGQAVAGLTACFSRHGVEAPTTGGSRALSTPNVKGLDTKSPAYHHALELCAPLIDAQLRANTKTRAPSPSRAPRTTSLDALKIPATVTATMKRFTACMRTDGVPAFPEPTSASFDLSATNIDSHTPAYRSAQAKCNSILQALDQPG